MSLAFDNTIRQVERRIDGEECRDVAGLFKVNEDEGSPNLVWMMGQFWSHLIWDSVVDADGELVFTTSRGEGVPMNRYDFVADGLHGFYHPRGAKSMNMTKDGRFRMSDDGKSLWRVKDGDAEFEIGGDPARVNENAFLGAVTAMFQRLHNKLIDEGKTFDDARRIVVSAMQHSIEDAFLPFCQMDKREFRNVHFGSMVHEVVASFQCLRLHQLVPSTVDGVDLFDKSLWSGDIDLAKVIDLPGGAFGMRMGERMNVAAMGGDPTAGGILSMTIGDKHNGADCPTWGDVARAVRFRADPETAAWPAFAGMAHEAKDGLPGPIGARIIADAVSSSFEPLEYTDEGLWLDAGDEYPVTMHEVIQYVEG